MITTHITPLLSYYSASLPVPTFICRRFKDESWSHLEKHYGKKMHISSTKCYSPLVVPKGSMSFGFSIGSKKKIHKMTQNSW